YPLQIGIDQRDIGRRSDRQCSTVEFEKFCRLDRVHLDQVHDVDLAVLVDQQIDEKSKLGFKTNHSKRRLIELDLFHELGVRRVIRTQDRQRAVGISFQDCID